MRMLGLLLASCLLLPAQPGAAHEIGLSQGHYARDGDTLRVELAFAPGELALAWPQFDRNGDDALDADELADAAALQAALAADTRAQAGASPCPLAAVAARDAGEAGLRLTLAFACPPAAGAATLRLALLERLTPGHRHLAQVEAAASYAVVLHAAQPALALAAQPAGGSTAGFAGMVAYGLEHILLGWDHLAFLLGLVALGGRGRDLLAAITAFTVAHSVTLALAAMQWVAPASALVEPVIALSIAWVGLENLRGAVMARRWRLAFAFGLVHGFGFAGALGETAIAPEALPASLLAFNLGVEAGQLAVLALLLPLLQALRRSARYSRGGFVAINGALVLAGLAWFAQRVAG